MAEYKHVGRVKKNNAKVIIVFRTLPGDPYSALVMGTDNLTDLYHNSIMTLLESPQGQQSGEFGDIMSTRFFPDGRQMLSAMHIDGRLVKLPTSDILVTPTPTDSVSLDELNLIIAEQKGITLSDLGVKTDLITEEAGKTSDPVSQSLVAEPLSDSDLARSYRSQADKLYKEAASLRKQADDLDPPKKKSTKAKAAVDLEA